MFVDVTSVWWFVLLFFFCVVGVGGGCLGTVCGWLVFFRSFQVVSVLMGLGVFFFVVGWGVVWGAFFVGVVKTFCFFICSACLCVLLVKIVMKRLFLWCGYFRLRVLVV